MALGLYTNITKNRRNIFPEIFKTSKCHKYLNINIYTPILDHLG